MKKKLMVALGLLILSTLTAYSKIEVPSELTPIIRLYKLGNYTEAYTKAAEFVKKEPANALGYYYMGISASQLGKKDEALDYYNKASILAPENSADYDYAARGKLCIETPNKCQNFNEKLSELDEFISNKNMKVTEEVQAQYEKLKIENFMREMNRTEDIQPQKFKEYYDFSSMNNMPAPTNDEIVAALRTLQRAGLGNFVNNNDISMLNYSQQNPILNSFGTSDMNPKLIQALLTNTLTQGF